MFLPVVDVSSVLKLRAQVLTGEFTEESAPRKVGASSEEQRNTYIRWAPSK